MTLRQGPGKKASSNRNSLARQGSRVLILAAVISLGFHFTSLFSLRYFYPQIAAFRNQPAEPVKIHISMPPMPENEEDAKKILESKLSKTEPPKDAKYASEVAHQTDKETRIERDANHKVNADAGKRGTTEDPNRAKDKSIAKVRTPELQEQTANQTPGKENKPKSEQKVDPKKAKMSIGGPIPKENKAEIAALLPSASELLGRMNAGYQEFIEDTIDLGEAIDINTAEYRYVGYFTSMRKNIELVWNYPYEAAVRGMEGKVVLAFNIESDGSTSKIKVIESSGFKILDDAIVHAIQLASPFAPIPGNMKQERLTIKGSFYYRLSNLLGAH